jgi:hypothetical protein
MIRAVAEALPGTSLDTPLGDRRPEVVQALAASTLVQAMARSRAAAAYEATVGYLRQSGLLGGHQVGLVDVGWLGHASASLAAVAADQGTRVRCYFAGGLCGRGSQRAPQGSRAFLIDARGEESKLRPALVHLIESFCAGSGDSVIGYVRAGDRWQPRFDDAGGRAATQWGLADYQALIRSYVQAACHAARKAEADVSLPELAALRPALIANLQALWRTPNYAEAEFWGSFPFESDYGLTKLAQPVSRIDLLAYARHFARPVAWPRFGPWRQAVLVRTIGGGRFTDPFGLLQALSPARRRTLRAKVRARLARQVEIQIGDIALEGNRVTVRRGPGRRP